MNGILKLRIKILNKQTGQKREKEKKKKERKKELMLSKGDDWMKAWEFWGDLFS